MLKISMENIDKLYAAIKESRDLFLPIESAGHVQFAEHTDDAVVRLDVLKTVKSAKDAFFPQSEDLMEFKVCGKEIDVIPPSGDMKEFVIMGVKACDAKSFEILDRVYLKEPVDSYYALRREKGLVVVQACGRPEESCFCNVFGIDATAPVGDVVTYLVDGTLYWDAQTEKGKELTDIIASVFDNADASDDAKVEASKAETKAIMEKLPFADLDLSRFNGDNMMEIFKDERWNDLYKACLGCGTCTFVCPTCQCYDIKDYDTGHGIKRFRCWDSCMYSDFTMMAHGNNRNSQMERFRQRFMHKLVYYPSNNEGIYSCVGCGRCVNKCPISMNIVKVIKTMGVTDNE